MGIENLSGNTTILSIKGYINIETLSHVPKDLNKDVCDGDLYLPHCNVLIDFFQHKFWISLSW